MGKSVGADVGVSQMGQQSDFCPARSGAISGGRLGSGSLIGGCWIAVELMVDSPPPLEGNLILRRLPQTGPMPGLGASGVPVVAFLG